MIPIKFAWPEISVALNKMYNIVGYHNFLTDQLDINPNALYQTFSKYKDIAFNFNDRVIIYLPDTDYYQHYSNVGFFCRNLYTVFSYFNIPPEFFIILTFQKNRKLEVSSLAQELNLQESQTIYNPYSILFPHPSVIDHNITLNYNAIEYPFVCLNGVPRASRIYNMCMLLKYQIDHKGIVSFFTSPRTTVQELTNTNIVDLPHNINLLGCHPPTRINDKLILTSLQHETMNKYYHLAFKNRRHEKIIGGPNSDNAKCQPLFIQHALWNLVLETVADYPKSHVSEKTIKAILTKRPFIVLGAKNTLDLIKQLGFKSFSPWIDESYDNKETFANRDECAIGELRKFCEMSPIELQEIAKDMSDTLEYNFNHYINGFGRKDLDFFINNML